HLKGRYPVIAARSSCRAEPDPRALQDEQGAGPSTASIIPSYPALKLTADTADPIGLCTRLRQAALAEPARTGQWGSRPARAHTIARRPASRERSPPPFQRSDTASSASHPTRVLAPPEACSARPGRSKSRPYGTGLLPPCMVESRRGLMDM